MKNPNADNVFGFFYLPPQGFKTLRGVKGPRLAQASLFINVIRIP